MKRSICYILYTDKENESRQIDNNRILIVIIKINPNKFTGTKMRRFDEVYCDAIFSQRKYDLIVKEIFKPLVYKNGIFSWI